MHNDRSMKLPASARSEIDKPPAPESPRSSGPGGPVSRIWRRLPRIETVILLAGLLCNAYGKLVMLRGHEYMDSWTLIRAVATDVAFFGGAAILFEMIRVRLPMALATRLPMIIAVLLCAWSVANMAWLIATGIQIHISVFSSLLHDPGEFGGIVLNRLRNTPRFTIPTVTAVLFFGVIFVRRLICPERISFQVESRTRIRRRYRVPVLAVIFGVTVSRLGATTDPRLGALLYSSHWFALASLAGFDGSSQPDLLAEGRPLARQGERPIAPPSPTAPKPNVVLVVMESTALWSTSLGGQPADQTPNLASLARQGVWIERARPVVTHTTQSQFSLLTGVDPNLEGDFVEAVLVDSPYESLATILRANGYRSRFSQMVRASFECNPGLVANLGFDSFWAREDAHDPASHLGYFSGDDFKMLGPAFDWMDTQKTPTMMFLMTSAAHHPYEAPAWFGPGRANVEQDYLQTVRYTDAFVGEVVAQLKKRGIFEDTLLCVVADHGEGIGRKGVLQHNSDPYEEALRVPWIITWPKKLPAGKVVRENCSLVDLTPTLLSLLGNQIQNAAFTGVDALGSVPPLRRLWFKGWQTDAPGGYVEGDTKVIYWPSLGKAFSFDLATDPDENEPIALDDQATAEVRQSLGQWRSRSRISFHPKRYREHRLFERWQVFALGNMAWCYYVDDTMGTLP